MLLLGLTGSIATGKSSVVDILRHTPYSLPIIDADVLARKVVEPGTPGYGAIVAEFAATTPDLLLNDAETSPAPLNRPALGRRVFGTHPKAMAARKKLNSIVHPAVRREMWKSLAKAYFAGNWAVVLDIPLLYESGWERLCGCIMVVAVHDPAVQMRRLMERDAHLSEEDAGNRVGSQMDVREKAERCLRRGKGAGVVVWNDTDKAGLQKEVDKVMAEIKRGSPNWWAWLLLLLPPAAVTVGLWNYVRSWWVQRQWSQEMGMKKAKL